MRKVISEGIQICFHADAESSIQLQTSRRPTVTGLSYGLKWAGIASQEAHATTERKAELSLPARRARFNNPKRADRPAAIIRQ